MLVLTQGNNIVNISTEKDFYIFVKDYSKVSRTIYQEINDDNQYQVILKEKGIFSNEITLGAFSSAEMAEIIKVKLFKAIVNNNITNFDIKAEIESERGI